MKSGIASALPWWVTNVGCGLQVKTQKLNGVRAKTRRSAGSKCAKDWVVKSGLVCVNNIGANYGFRSNVDVCETPNANSVDPDNTPLDPLSTTGLWWSSEESGWGITLNQQGTIIFVTMFTYDISGLPVWYVASNCTVSDQGCTGELYKVTGGIPISENWNGSNMLVQAVGSITFLFADDNNATVSFTLDGISNSKAITRQIFGTLSPGTPMTALWWNPDESGWGVTLTRQTDTAFATLFTYNNNGFPTWYVASNCTVAGTTCSGDLFEVTGGSSISDTWNGANIIVTSVGTITFEFSDDDNGTVSFIVNGVSGSKTITRQVFN